MHYLDLDDCQCIALPFFIVIQLLDTSGYTKDMHRALADDMQAAPAVDQLIINLIKQSQIVIFYPKMNCLAFVYNSHALLTSTQMLSAQAKVPINTAYTARFIKTARCVDEGTAFPNFSKKLLISDLNHLSPTIQNERKTHPQACQMIGTAYYCLISNAL